MTPCAQELHVVPVMQALAARQDSLAASSKAAMQTHKSCRSPRSAPELHVATVMRMSAARTSNHVQSSRAAILPHRSSRVKNCVLVPPAAVATKVPAARTRPAAAASTPSHALLATSTKGATSCARATPPHAMLRLAARHTLAILATMELRARSAWSSPSAPPMTTARPAMMVTS